jgi:hypothetical protein
LKRPCPAALNAVQTSRSASIAAMTIEAMDLYPPAIITILSPWFLDNGPSGIERQYLATTEVGGGNYSNLEFKPTRTLGGRQFTMLTPTTTKKGCFNAVGVPRLTVRYSVFTVKFLAMAYANSHALGITF